MTAGFLNLVSVGPGYRELIVPQAADALRESEVVVGYELYLHWIAPWIEGKQIITLPLTQERERARLAIEHARAGQRVALVSSGDIGVYAMAALASSKWPRAIRSACASRPASRPRTRAHRCSAHRSRTISRR